MKHLPVAFISQSQHVLSSFFLLPHMISYENPNKMSIVITCLEHEAWSYGTKSQCPEPLANRLFQPRIMESNASLALNDVDRRWKYRAGWSRLCHERVLTSPSSSNVSESDLQNLASRISIILDKHHIAYRGYSGHGFPLWRIEHSVGTSKNPLKNISVSLSTVCLIHNN
jgi:hypothetical protein